MDYKNSKIYAIKSDLTDKIYIGSTTQRLCKRFSQHKDNFLKNKETVSSFELFKIGNCFIELIELFPCSCKEELFKKEGEIIRQFKDIVINKQIAGRKNKEWYEDNKEKQITKQKKYSNDNKDKVKEYQKEYYEKNKEKLIEYQNKNKEKNNEKKRERYLKKKMDI